MAREHPSLEKVGRAGWFAKGVVYVGAGALTLLLAAKATGWSGAASTGSQEASPTGALKTIAEMSGGRLLIALLAVGMLVYAAWRLWSAMLPGSSGAKAWATRVGYLVSAVLYTGLALTAVSLARAAHATADGNSEVTSLSARVMSHQGGRLVIGVAGTVAIGAGLYRVVKGVRTDIGDELEWGGWSPRHRTWARRAGVVGEIGRGVGIALIGFFLLRSAIRYDAAEATGLDGALRRVATHNWGLMVVAVVGVGFAAYGAFCLATFTHRRLEAP